MSKSNYLENALLALELGHSLWPVPPVHHIALFTSAPNDAGGGVEVSGPGYQRKAMNNDGTLWSAPASGESSNAVAVQFAEPAGDWGTVTHFAIYDANSGGNLLRWGPITTPRTIGAGFIPFFPVGAMRITED